MELLSWAFSFIWDTAYGILNFTVNLGDFSFTLWQFALGSSVIYIVIRLVRGIILGDPD